MLEDVVVRDCRSEASGGGIYALEPTELVLVRSAVIGNEGAGAAGLWVLGDPPDRSAVRIEESTLSGNEVLVSLVACCSGAALYSASAEIRRSTFSGNVATESAGALGVLISDVTLDGVTIVENVGDRFGSPDPMAGGVIVVGAKGDAASLSMRNSILADNLDGFTDELDLQLGQDASVGTQGFNLIGSNAEVTTEMPAGTPNVHGDWVGTALAPLDPELESLADQGGPTEVHLPAAGSIVIDRGSWSQDPWDQRHFGDPVLLSRPVDDPSVVDVFDGCDIGAVERGAVWISGEIFGDGFESGDVSAWH